MLSALTALTWDALVESGNCQLTSCGTYMYTHVYSCIYSCSHPEVDRMWDLIGLSKIIFYLLQDGGKSTFILILILTLRLIVVLTESALLTTWVNLSQCRLLYSTSITTKETHFDLWSGRHMLVKPWASNGVKIDTRMAHKS